MDYDIPSESQIQVRLHATDLSKCGTGNGENAGNWVIQDISRTLIGRGAHRMLQSTVTLSGSPGSSQRLHDGCYLRLVQSLPTGVFADQFELQGIQRRGGMKLELLPEILKLLSEQIFQCRSLSWHST